jgi:DNA (cytosine-5)-methyltransferase 1
VTAYYNEIDPFAAAWLRDLIDAGEIAPGDVDTRSIEDVCPDDLRPYTQVHFFAGIGIWSHALRRAGWADDRRIWTGSCPCQPFSSAGEGNGFADERHLWPAMFHLIAALGPDVVIGEQVASKDGLAWLDLVSADMEAARYAFGAIDLCAAGFGAPHIRQRSWWVALANGQGGRRGKLGDALEPWGSGHADGGVILGRVDDMSGARYFPAWGREPGEIESNGRFGRGMPSEGCGIIGLDDDDDARPQGYAGDDGATGGRGEPGRSIAAAGIPNELVGKLTRLERPGPTNGFWRDVDWLYCRDERWRPVMPHSFPLVNGAPARVGRLRGYGNGIVAPVATAFIEEIMSIVN